MVRSAGGEGGNDPIRPEACAEDGDGWAQGGQGWERRAGRVLGPRADSALGMGEDEADGGGWGGHPPGTESGGLAVRRQEATARAEMVLSSEGGE